MTRGVVGLLGSGEFLPWAADVDRWLLDHAGDGDGSVAIIPTAAAPEGDAVFDEWGRKGLSHYRAMGVAARVVSLKTREDANDETVLAQIEGASLMFLSGGNPMYLADTLRDTAIWRRILDRVAAGAAVAGCSAGACIFGEIAPDSATEDMHDAFRHPGLAVFGGIVFGAHWDMLDTYYPDLRGIAIREMPDGMRMVGIDENTAMVSNGEDWTVLGSSGVHVYEGEGALSYTAGQTFPLP